MRALVKRFNQWRRTLRYKVILLVVSSVLVPMLIVGWYLYDTISTILIDQANTNMTQTLQQMNNDIESQFNMVNTVSMQILMNPTIRSSLENQMNEEDPYQQVKKKVKIDNELKYFLQSNYAWESKLLKSIFIFENEAQYYFVTRNYYDVNSVDRLRVYKDALTQQTDLTLKLPSPEDPTIYLIRKIYSIYSTKELLGRLIIGIDEESLSRTYESINQYPNAYAFIADHEGKYFSHTDKSLLGMTADVEFSDMLGTTASKNISIQGKHYIVASQKINGYELTSVILIPTDVIFASLPSKIKPFLLIFAVLVFISLLFGLFLSARVLRPIKDLMKKIERVKTGAFHTKMPVYKDEELNRLSRVFNSMTDEIQHLIHQVYEKQLLLKESELKTLQSQIKPHFLFNVLEVISWQARLSNNPTIYKMITSVGQLLRVNLTMGSKEKITIKEELEYIEFYLYLQKARFEDRLQIDIDYEDAEILDGYLPKLCIQPIVENAVIHGLEKKRGQGKLVVRIFREQDTLCFIVSDNGIGFDTSQVQIHSAAPINRQREGHTSVGLYNVNQRIKLIYGEAYGVTLQSKMTEGTQVTVRIPIDQGG